MPRAHPRSNFCKQALVMAGAWQQRNACMLLVLLVMAADMPLPCTAGCSGITAGSSDNEDDCTALLTAYAAWGNKPTSWAAGIAAGTSYGCICR